ncbi:MAG TPA: tripartite tricarboxylate transporter permease, partial [Burkholderiaceae bacterium]|nr:tripartite tricarboxylate transporter permease [Burkholderiaceae bacterium]
FWGLIVSMWIGNAMLVVLNLPLVGIWVKLLTIPYRLLFPAILLFACIGSYSANNSAVDIYLCALFGLMGYLFIKFGCELAPLLLGFVLGPMMEENLRRALFISEGDPSVLIQRPISASMLAISAAALVLVVLPAVRRKRSEVLVASD